ncbi:coniferyl-alcohol dehydrogenase [Thermomonospora sp. CIF 1]|uniref:coniferyl-alcohol dehydrogenase n=1 Tax=Thermomonospora sp. CIF 1 TaxID=1916083 RepID=UPI000CAB79FB|nr:coniferyl-alcohol dehydrogenase [Thermomonospora sp. CIF 1]PKK14021.1 MAG: oxidoreductase [Thermomonospora sp. CIF 1]
MSGRRIVVTGAASGIGRALADRLLAAGDQVVGLDRAPCPERITTSLQVDLGDAEAVRAAVSSLAGPVDGIANVAGVPGTAPPEVVLSVNLLGARVLTEALLPQLTEGAAVVNVASVAAHRNTVPPEALDELIEADGAAAIDAWLTRHPLSGPAAYDTSKAAMVAWTERLAARLLPRRVRALSISPGPVQTPILDDFRTTMGADRFDGAVALLGRHGTAGEIAAVVAFALSADASWLNGVDIPVEGGLYAARKHARP